MPAEDHRAPKSLSVSSHYRFPESSTQDYSHPVQERYSMRCQHPCSQPHIWLMKVPRAYRHESQQYMRSLLVCGC